MQQFSSNVLPIQQYFIQKERYTLSHIKYKPEFNPKAVWTLCSRNNSHVLPDIQSDTKETGTFEKSQQKLKKSKKKNLLTEIEPLQLPF